MGLIRWLFLTPAARACADTIRYTLYDTMRYTLYDTMRYTLYDTMHYTLYDTMRYTLYDTIRYTLAFPDLLDWLAGGQYACAARHADIMIDDS